MRVRSSSRAMTLPVLFGALVFAGCESATEPVATGLEPSFAVSDGGYELLDIGTLGGSFSSAFDVNSSGHVVGRSQTADLTIRAFLYADGAMTNLGSPGAGVTEAWYIGEGGQIAGIYREGGVTRTVVWDGGATSVIDGLGGALTFPTAVGPSGTVVGWSKLASGERHAFRWTASGGIEDLGTLGGSESAALGINAAGDIAGWARNGDEHEQAVVWTAAGAVVELGTLGGGGAEALAINDNGQVAGTAETAGGDMHAFLWSAEGGMQDLTPGLSGAAEAIALNQAGQAAVRVMSATDKAFLWDGVQLVDLATLGGVDSDVVDLDGSGVAAGVSETSDGSSGPAAWPASTPAALPLGGADEGAAEAASEAGTIVGNIRFGSVLHAAIWTAEGTGGPGDPPGDPSDPIQALIDAVNAMADAGDLSLGRANALLRSLHHARDMRDEDRPGKALLQLRAFSHKVQAMIHGEHMEAAKGSELFGLYVDAVKSL